MFGKVIEVVFLSVNGARNEIMEMVAPLGPMYQAGTLSGNPIAMASGLATLTHLKEQNPYKDSIYCTEISFGFSVCRSERGSNTANRLVNDQSFPPDRKVKILKMHRPVIQPLLLLFLGDD